MPPAAAQPRADGNGARPSGSQSAILTTVSRPVPRPTGLRDVPPPAPDPAGQDEPGAQSPVFGTECHFSKQQESPYWRRGRCHVRGPDHNTGDATKTDPAAHG
ncbi:hypothetical protein JCM16408A_51530 [Methylobacterium phyllosphaerae]